MKRSKRNQKKRTQPFSQGCYRCEHSEYIGDGDHICIKYEEDPDRAVVISDWEPTDNYMQCKRKENQR